MKLLPNWRTVLRHAWSLRLMVLAASLSALEVVMAFLDPEWFPPGILAAASGVVTASAFMARLIVQKPITPGADDGV